MQNRLYVDAMCLTDGQLSCLCDKCHQAIQCHGTQCFSSIKVGGTGVVFERGCLMDSEKIRMQCSTPSSFHYAIFCCSEEMCNSNTTARSLMARLPTGGYCVPCSAQIQFMEYYDLIPSFISP